MTLLFVFCSVAAGLIVGSFLNVLVDRGARNEAIRGRSYCESCKKTLSVKELIPVLSYLIQKGRCRTCGAVLSLQYPLVEAGTGIIFGIISWKLAPQISLDFFSLLAVTAAFAATSAAIIIFVHDIRWHVIPDGALITMGLAGILFSLLRIMASPLGWKIFFYDVATAITLSLFIFSLWFLSHGRWIGFGDVKLVLATSLLVGFPQSIPAFVLSFWTGGLIGLMLIFLKKRGLRDEIPFGPFILLGAALSLFVPKSIIPFFILI